MGTYADDDWHSSPRKPCPTDATAAVDARQAGVAAGLSIGSGGTTMAIQTDDNTTRFDRKSGKGQRDGVISELFTLWDVKPGHEAELRAALER
jgi:hypothetical protein